MASRNEVLPRLVPELEALTREITRRQSTEGVLAAAAEPPAGTLPIGVAL